MTHTPGPWNIKVYKAPTGKEYFIDGPNDEAIAYCGHTTLGKNIADNATLMATAPRLLKCCEVALDFFIKAGHGYHTPNVTELAAAILQARGVYGTCRRCGGEITEVKGYRGCETCGSEAL